MKKLCIFGSNSHLAKSICLDLFDLFDEIDFYSRDFSFVASLGLNDSFKNRFSCKDYQEFSTNKEYSLIINFIGGSDPKKRLNQSLDFFKVSSYFDNLILDYLSCNPQTQYIYISSGAVFQSNICQKPVDIHSFAQIKLNNVYDEDWYKLSKIFLELRHRSLKNFKIVDLRVFSYVSPQIDLSSSLFISEIINSLLLGKTFVTNQSNFIRDYCGSHELLKAIEILFKNQEINIAYDLFSKKSASKEIIIETLQKKFNLKVNYKNNYDGYSEIKKEYYSKNKSLSSLGYNPTNTSLENIKQTIKILKSYC